MQMVTAESYSAVKDRQHIQSLPKVKAALKAVIEAQPTTITPRDRSELIKAILDDLRNELGAAWYSWSDDVIVLALQAVKILGRNPIGSECIAEKRQLASILFHSKLTPEVLSLASKSSIRSTPSPPPANRSSHKSEKGLSPAQTEAISIVANTLTLHPVLARKNILDLGGGKGALRSLKECAYGDADGFKGKAAEKDNNDGSSGEEMVFLLCRVIFLLTVKPGSLIVEFVDEGGGVGALAQILQSIRPTPPNYKAVSEVLKVVYNIVAHYNPSKGGQSKVEEDEDWNQVFDVLLQPIIDIVYTLQLIDLLPPLTNAIHALTLFPYNSKLLPAWLSVPTFRSSPPPSSSPDKRIHSPKRRSIYQLFSFGSGSGQSALPPSTTLSPPLARASSRGSQGRSPRSSHESSGSESGGPMPLVQRLLQALNNFLSNNLPPLPLTPDDDLPPTARGLVMDEVLPPVFGLFTRMAMGSDTLREQFRLELLPDSLDRSPGSTPLEDRATLLGHLLRFLRSTSHPHSQQTLDHFFWSMSGNDANSLVNDIGYGNAAGLLFRRGITGPSQNQGPSAHIEEINDDDEEERAQSSQSTSQPTKTQPTPPRRASSKNYDQTRDTITGLQPDPKAAQSPLAGMTNEEKEREAERLFVMFDRMDKNPAMKIMENPMHAAVRKGDTEKWDVEDTRQEVEEGIRQEAIDEEEALREITAWKQRMRRK